MHDMGSVYNGVENRELLTMGLLACCCALMVCAKDDVV